MTKVLFQSNELQVMSHEYTLEIEIRLTFQCLEVPKESLILDFVIWIYLGFGIL